MKFLSPAQCRAARGLLDWSQPDLAQKCNMHVQTISAFEHGTGTPTKKTLEKIMNAFEYSGVEFTSDNGVKSTSLKTITYREGQGFMDFMDYVYETARDVGGEFCVSNVDEKLFTKKMGIKIANLQMERMAKIKDNFTFRIIVKEGDKNYVASNYAEYRCIPKDNFHDVPFYVFGDNLAFIIFEKKTTIHLIKNTKIASAQRTQFDLVWDNAKKVNK